VRKNDMKDLEIPDTIKVQILQNKLQVWHNTYVSAEIDAKIAQALGDNKMLNQAKDNMKRALQAANVVSDMLEQLDQCPD